MRFGKERVPSRGVGTERGDQLWSRPSPRSAVKVSELEFSYPEELVALGPRSQSRVLWSEAGLRPHEVSWQQLLSSLSVEDLLVLNNTRVVPARVFAAEGLDLAT